MKCPVVDCPRYSSGAKGCPEPDCPNFALYRAATGRCDTCGQEMAKHTVCQGCGILVGRGHITEGTSPFRGRNLCQGCREARLTLERLLGREIPHEGIGEAREKLGRRMLKALDRAPPRT